VIEILRECMMNMALREFHFGQSQIMVQIVLEIKIKGAIKMFLSLLLESIVLNGANCYSKNKKMKAGIKKACDDGMCIRFKDKIIYPDGRIVYKNNK
jgi:hypothetical protein